MSSDRIVISGATGGVSQRLEINDFIQNAKLFTLYIRALQSLQSVDEVQDGSFFGIGGIHGQPYVAWNGATGSFAPGKWPFGGYCTHGSALFPTWHRPYVLLIEQLLQQLAIAAASQFTVDTQSWKDAAVQFRVPYWDWAKNSVPPDAVINSPTLTITNFDGSSVQVDNPIMHYRFKNTPLPFDPPFDQIPTTLRHPDSNGNENIPELQDALSSIQTQTSDDTMALLNMVHDWPTFSNHRDSQGSQTNSLESIHDNIHVQVGGQGHMSSPNVAAFDPIFYLHHANVDRLLSLWSALNLDVVVNRSPNDQAGTFTLSPSTTLDVSTDLSPFWDSESTFWQSGKLFNDSKHFYNTDTLGYTYPDFATINRNQPAQVKDAAQKSVNVLLQQTPESIFNVNSDNDDVDQWYNWTARIRVKKFELGRSFSVLIFLGEVPKESKDWLGSNNLVGIHHVFANSASGECENCSSNINLIHEGFIHLNRHILRVKPNQTAFDPETIKPYLKDNLHWRTIDTNGQPVQVNSLEVIVLSVTLSKASDSNFPATGDRQLHHGVTSGRPGGATQHTSD